MLQAKKNWYLVAVEEQHIRDAQVRAQALPVSEYGLADAEQWHNDNDWRDVSGALVLGVFCDTTGGNAIERAATQYEIAPAHLMYYVFSDTGIQSGSYAAVC